MGGRPVSERSLPWRRRRRPAKEEKETFSLPQSANEPVAGWESKEVPNVQTEGGRHHAPQARGTLYIANLSGLRGEKERAWCGYTQHRDIHGAANLLSKVLYENRIQSLPFEIQKPTYLRIA
nr:hypothetical protein [Aneurinibacillus thermoaerophilus]